jgi:hypothetical protein
MSDDYRRNMVYDKYSDTYRPSTLADIRRGVVIRFRSGVSEAQAKIAIAALFKTGLVEGNWQGDPPVSTEYDANYGHPVWYVP